MTRSNWVAATACTLVWLASVVTLTVVAVRGATGPDVVFGAVVQLLVTAAASPALWLWWRRLWMRHHDAMTPPEVAEPSGPHRSLHGDVPPPQRW